jgi:glucose-6-phosphate 1-dehydrogenase
VYTVSDKVLHSDALVLFGATGYLAFKMIFPAHYALSKRRRLMIPVLGVLRRHPKSLLYKRGTWGPKEANTLIAADGSWSNPRDVDGSTD